MLIYDLKPKIPLTHSVAVTLFQRMGSTGKSNEASNLF
jgi:hypothetical protein